jgi:hypothetical protein
MEIFTFIHSDRVAVTVCTELTPEKGNGKRVGDISGKFFFFLWGFKVLQFQPGSCCAMNFRAIDLCR